MKRKIQNSIAKELANISNAVNSIHETVQFSREHTCETCAHCKCTFEDIYCCIERCEDVDDLTDTCECWVSK